MANSGIQKKPEMMIPEEVMDTVKTTERNILAALMCHPKAADIVFARLDGRDLTDPVHREVYQAAQKVYLAGGTPGIIEVIQRLTDTGRLAVVGGPMVVAQICDAYITAADINKNIDYVQAHAKRRRLMELGRIITATALETDVDAEELTSRAQSMLDRVSDVRDSDVTTVADLTENVVNSLLASVGMGDRVLGLSTGYRDVDKVAGGFNPGEFVVAAGATGMGKTAFALNIAQNVAIKQKNHVIILSLEMSAEQLTKRLLCSIGRIPSVELRYVPKSKKQAIEQKLNEAKQILDAAPIHIIERSDMSISDVTATCRRLQHQCGGLGLIIVDYLQLLHGSPATQRTGNRVVEMGEVSRSLKQMAQQLKVPVLALSQVNRGVDATQSKRPTLAHIRDTAAIAQDADKIILLYRADYYRIQEGSTEPLDHILDVLIAKNRDGHPGAAKLYFDECATMLRSLAKEDGPDANRF